MPKFSTALASSTADISCTSSWVVRFDRFVSSQQSRNKTILQITLARFSASYGTEVIGGWTLSW